jgi:hypothetical protein
VWPARKYADEVIALLDGKRGQPAASSSRAIVSTSLDGEVRRPSTRIAGAHHLVQRIIEPAVERMVDRVLPLETVVHVPRKVAKPRRKLVPRTKVVERPIERVTWKRAYVYKTVEKPIHKEARPRATYHSILTIPFRCTRLPPT